MAFACEVDARVGLVRADRDVRVALVVAQPDVELRTVTLDQVGLEDQRLALARGDHHLDPVDVIDHLPRARMGVVARTEGLRIALRQGCAEVREHALTERLGLPHVEHRIRFVPVHVDTGPIRKSRKLRADLRVCGHTIEYRSIVPCDAKAG